MYGLGPCGRKAVEVRILPRAPRIKMDELDTIEEGLRESDQKKRKSSHKVSGKSVFKLKEIIEEKGKEIAPENISDAKSRQQED